MRVLYVLPITWGGIPHYTAELANATSKYAEVVVLKPIDDNDELFSESVELLRVFKPIKLSKDGAKRLFSFRNFINFFSFKNIKNVKDINPDLIHFPELYFQTSLFTFLFRLYKRYPTICTYHATFESYIASPSEYGLSNSVILTTNRLGKGLVKPNKIIVHSQKSKDNLIKKGTNPENISMILPGAREIFKRYSEEGFEEENCILFFGRIAENKGIEFLIKAMKLVFREVPDSKLVIAGEGDLSKCSKYIEDDSRFEIHNSFVPNEKVAQFFQRAKLVVLPYTSQQGRSGVLATAFSFGKPVIVTDVGDFPDLVANGEEGLIVPSKDPKSLTGAIIEILKNKKLRKEMGAKSLKKSEELSWDKVARKHLKVYEEVIKRND